MASLLDVQQAKRAISGRLLNRGIQSSVLGMRATLSVARAVERAGRNVHAVGVGYKFVKGKSTKQLCVRVHVVQKLPKSLLSPRDVVPLLLDGVPTDIVEAAPAFLAGKRRARRRNRTRASRTDTALAAPAVDAHSDTLPLPELREKQRPVTPGCSTGHFRVGAGTIGCFCRSSKPNEDPEDVYVLSASHVLAPLESAIAGNDVFQPGSLDGGTDEHQIADLSRFEPIETGGTLLNRVDCAIAKMIPDITTDRRVPKVGEVRDSKRAALRMEVVKVGRTTGRTSGTIVAIDMDILVGIDPEAPQIVARFEDQICIEPPQGSVFGLAGDSGSLVVEKGTGKAVGLYFAGPESGTYGLANHFGDVCRRLEIELI